MDAYFSSRLLIDQSSFRPTLYRSSTLLPSSSTRTFGLLLCGTTLVTLKIHGAWGSSVLRTRLAILINILRVRAGRLNTREIASTCGEMNTHCRATWQ